MRPDADDWFVLWFGGVIAGVFALLRYITRWPRNWKRVIGGTLASGAWGGIGAWGVTSVFPDMPAPLLGVVSASLGWLGYEAVAAAVSDIGRAWLRKAMPKEEEDS